MFVIGITGSLGSGKTTVSCLFKELGATVIEADKVAHELLKKGRICYKEVVRAFGKDILTSGQIDRKKLAARVFSSSTKLKNLTGIIHPRVIKVFKHNIKNSGKNKIIVLDVPLLFEAGIDKMCDLTIAVKVKQNTSIERAVKRLGITKKEAKKRIKIQLSQKEKIRLADIVIDNESLTKTKKQVRKLWQEIAQDQKRQ